MQKYGVRVDSWQPRPQTDVKQYLVKANDPIDEVSRCARWARRILERTASAKIAVVAPQLDAYQLHIERAFTAELEPESFYGSVEEPYTYNLSLGRSLDSEDVVFAALRLLRFSMQVDQHEISWLLHTPHVGASVKEKDCRARLDRELVRLRRSSWALSRLSKSLSGLAEKHAAPGPEMFRIIEILSAELGKKNSESSGLLGRPLRLVGEHAWLGGLKRPFKPGISGSAAFQDGAWGTRQP